MNESRREALRTKALTLGGKGKRLTVVAARCEAAAASAIVDALECGTETKDRRVEDLLAKAATLEREAAHLRLEAWIAAKEGGW